MKGKSFLLKRILGYILGFILFYEPFILFEKAAGKFITEPGFTSIHVPCPKIPLQEVFTGKLLDCGPISLFFLGILVVVSLIWGPLFCGKLCPAGALPEFLSRLVPEKFKLDWSHLVPVVPLRYGFFAGFLFSTYLGMGLPCPYCNYYTFDILMQFTTSGQLISTMPSLLATFVLWFFILGLFTKGGRGYCLFLCPAGTFCSLLHFICSYLPGTWRMRVKDDQCVGCGLCVKKCPMRAVSLQDGKARVNLHQCIICQECEHNCPKQAIRYGHKKER